MYVICTGFLSEIWRVRLLSIPQQTTASSISRGPATLNLLWLGFQLKKTPATVMHNKENHNRFPVFSRKKKTAIMAVARPSMFNSNETENPEMKFNPII
jgi:hypothetical protein